MINSEISIFLKKAEEYVSLAIEKENNKEYGRARNYYLMASFGFLFMFQWYDGVDLDIDIETFPPNPDCIKRLTTKIKGILVDFRNIDFVGIPGIHNDCIPEGIRHFQLLSFLTQHPYNSCHGYLSPHQPFLPGPDRRVGAAISFPDRQGQE